MLNHLINNSLYLKTDICNFNLTTLFTVLNLKLNIKIMNKGGFS
jgi:hypothetical protein